MTDPYEILGVPHDADDETIKKAYRELARKYHPDNYADNPLSDLAEQKMKEINEAYDTIQKMRSGTSGSGNGGTYTGSGSENYNHIRNLINDGKYKEADIILEAMGQGDRNAEWNFLKGCILMKKGWYFDAQKYFESACYMDPSNAEYRAALNNIRGSAQNYDRRYRTDNGAGCSACDMCTGLICADCCCECMGGDLISCC